MPEKLSRPVENLMREVGVRQARMIRRQQESSPSFWRSVAMVGAIGWSVALPTLIGVAAGAWIDHHWPSRFSWTLMLLFSGLVLGLLDAWNRIKRAQEKH